MVRRFIPGSTRFAVSFGGLFQIIGWMGLGPGFALAWVVGSRIDHAFVTFTGPIATARGTVSSVEETSISQGKRRGQQRRPIVAYGFDFKDATGAVHNGVSYQSGKKLQIGDSVEIEYLEENPGRSRIRGFRMAHFGPEMFVIYIIPAIALVLLCIGRRKSTKALLLLEEGNLAMATVTAATATVMKYNGKYVYRRTLQFTTEDAGTVSASDNTHIAARYAIGHSEAILYQPANPASIVSVIDIPGLSGGMTRLDEIPPQPAWRIIMIALPLLFFLACVALCIALDSNFS